MMKWIGVSTNIAISLKMCLQDLSISERSPRDMTNSNEILKALSLWLAPFMVTYVKWQQPLSIVKTESFIEKGVKTYKGAVGQQRIQRSFFENYIIALPHSPNNKPLSPRSKSCLPYATNWKPRSARTKPTPKP